MDRKQMYKCPFIYIIEIQHLNPPGAETRLFLDNTVNP